MRLRSRMDLRVPNDPSSHPVWRDAEAALRQAHALDAESGDITLALAVLLVRDGRPAVAQPLVDELLSRVYGTEYPLPLCFFYGSVDEAPYHPKVYIRFEESHFDGFYGIFDVFFGYGGLTADGPQGVLKFTGYFFEHSFIQDPL